MEYLFRPLIAFFFCVEVSVISADNTWQYIISEHGYDTVTVNDMTKSAKIKLPEPVCAYVNITGINKMPTTKTQDLNAWLECYDGNGNYFRKRVVLNAQGNSSLSFPKKNLSVKFYETAWGEGKKTNITFGDWVNQDAFHLKAYYTDYFRGCSKIAYDIYDDITSDREQPLPWQRAGITTSSEKAICHPNGFPCYVYLNDVFYGLYVWSLKKDYKNMGHEKDNGQHIHIDGLLADNTIFNEKINWTQFDIRTPKTLYCINTDENMPAEDRQYLEYDDDYPSELIDDSMPYYDPNNQGHAITNIVKQSIISLSKYYTQLRKLDTSKPTSQTFKYYFSQFFDTQGLTDYIVHSLVTNNYDGHWKNWQWFTYDGKKWYVEPYDLDCTFGHHDSGAFIFPPEWNHQHGTYFFEFPVNAGIQQLFLKYFFDEIKERYITLRKKQLIDAQRYITYFKCWADRITSEGFDMEYAKWRNSPCIMETIVNSNWTTEDNWENYLKYPAYSPDSTYYAGDKCKDIFRIWTATATTKGVRPYKQYGQRDSQERVEQWITRRIALLDEYFKFDPDAINGMKSEKNATISKILLDTHLYIIKDDKVYSVDGKRIN